jgi:PST family polysaccharide transporter
VNLTRTAARGSAVTVGAQLVRLVLQFVGIIVLARILGPDDYALVAMVIAVIGFADLVRDGGLSTAAIQSARLSNGERTNLFWVNTGLGAAATVLVVASTPLIVGLYDQPTLARIVPVLAVTFLLAGLNTQFRVGLSRDMRFGALALADIAGQVLGVSVAIVIALLGGGYWALVAQQLTVTVVVLVVNAVNSRWLPGRPQRGASVRRFFGFGAKVLATQTLNYGAQSIDQILLGAVHTPTQLGIYNRAAQIVVTPLNQVNVPLSRVAIPVLSRAQDDDERFARAAARAQLAGAYVTASVLAVVAGLAGPVTDLLLGPGWAGVAPILMILAVSGIFRSVAHLNQWLFLARGRPGAQLKLDLWAKPVMVGLIAAGLPWGGVGVAAGSVAAWLFYWVVGVVFASRAVGLRAGGLLARAARALLFVGLPAGSLAYLGSTLTEGTLAQILLGGAAAVVGAAAVGFAVPPVRRDLLVLVGLVRQVLNRGPRRPRAAATR